MPVLSGLIHDGLGGVPFLGRITIKGDTIVSVEPLLELLPESPVIAPGFIDMHSHGDHFLLVDPSAASKIAQGVTLDVIGNCGYSAAPLTSTMAERRTRGLARYGLLPEWRSFDEYLRRLEEAGPALNVAALVGHGTLRAFCGIPDDRPALADERRALRRAAEEALTAGAVGLSSGLFYPPGRSADDAEIVELLAPVAERKALYVAHLRDEGAGVLAALDEALTAARRAGARFHYSHIKAWGRANWRLGRMIIARMRAALSEGQDLSADAYPYTSAATTLSSGLGLTGVETDRARITDALSERARLDPKWASRIRILSSADPDLAGRTLSSFDDPVETVIAALAGDPAISAAFEELSESNLRAFLKEPWVAIGSDSSNRAFTGRLAGGPAHPRAFGTFPRVLGRYARELGVVPLAEAIRRMTSLSADRLGLADRGRIAPGMKADLVLFDPATIAENATFDRVAPPRGIHEVWVNGVKVLAEGKMLKGRAGRVLRR
jgi:N-acyl-D-amino-acid deacylase